MNRLSHHERRGLEQTQAKGESHPDVDLLAAFSELALTERERQAVLAHLGTCPACRDVVALSASDVAASPATAVHTAQPWHLRWSVLRWGTLAASAVVIVAAVSIGYRESKQASPQRSEEQIAASLAKTTASQPVDQFSPPAPATGAPAGIKPPKIRYEKIEPDRAKELSPSVGQVAERNERELDVSPHSFDELRHDTDKAKVASEPTLADNSTASGAIVSGPRQQDQKSMLNSFEIKGRPVPATAPTLPPKSPAGTLQNTPSAPRSAEVAANDELPKAEAKDIQLPEKLSRQQEQMSAKKAAVPQASVSEVTNYSADTKNDVGRASTMMQWQVTRDGYLQRSNDRGRNWAQALPASGFRVVAFVHDEVWAGGANGVLLHSVDNGNTWAHISPRDKEVLLRGDVTGIKFTDAQHGTVTTSAGETWSTSDGGHNWSKQ
jgi:Photosynthesis system II assembly factor YCF48/Putative zinc-finger